MKPKILLVSFLLTSLVASAIFLAVKKQKTETKTGHKLEISKTTTPLINKSDTSTNQISEKNSSTNPNNSGFSPETQNILPKPLPPRKILIFIDDYSATPEKIEIKKGQSVSLIVQTKNTNVSTEGLELKSNIVNIGPIEKNSSQTVNFIAEKSFILESFKSFSKTKNNYIVEVIISG